MLLYTFDLRIYKPVFIKRIFMSSIQEKGYRKNLQLEITTCGSLQCNTRLIFYSLIYIAIAILVLSPVQAAGTKYMAGSPELSAYISGTNEVGPGDAVQLNVVIQNKGVNQFEFIQSSIISPNDLPNTAKFLTVSLDSGSAPVTIKSDPQMLGDLKGSSTTTCVISMKIDPNAPSGSYDLPLTLKYTYLYEADQYGTDAIQYFYRENNETFSLPIKIKPEVKISVLSAEGEHLNAGTEGYINLTVKNIGHENGKNAVIKIVRNDNSPILPTVSSMFIGDFFVDQVINSRFKVSISSDAEDQTYPLDVLVDYENNEGDQVTSVVETIGLPVGKKIDFAIGSTPNTVSPGQKKVVTVQYTNTGGATAYNVQARISAVDPFTSNDDTAFLGTLAPGQTGEAAFEISVDKTATIKEYALDSEVSYRDALDNPLISDPMKVRIAIVNETSPLSNPLVLTVIAAAVILVGYLIYRKRTSKH
jgi:hypothetical protein